MISFFLCILCIDTYTSIHLYLCTFTCPIVSHLTTLHLAFIPPSMLVSHSPFPTPLARLCVITYLLFICLSVMYVQDSHLCSTLHNSMCIRGFQKPFLGLSFTLATFFLYASLSLQHSEINMPAGASILESTPSLENDAPYLVSIL